MICSTSYLLSYIWHGMFSFVNNNVLFSTVTPYVLTNVFSYAKDTVDPQIISRTFNYSICVLIWWINIFYLIMLCTFSCPTDNWIIYVEYICMFYARKGFFLCVMEVRMWKILNRLTYFNIFDVTRTMKWETKLYVDQIVENKSRGIEWKYTLSKYMFHLSSLNLDCLQHIEIYLNIRGQEKVGAIPSLPHKRLLACRWTVLLHL